METHLLEIFKKRFKRRVDYGREYFEGDCSEMLEIIGEELKKDREASKSAPQESSEPNKEEKTDVVEEVDGDKEPDVVEDEDGDKEPHVVGDECKDEVVKTQVSIEINKDNDEANRETNLYRFKCTSCDYGTNKKSSYDNHMLSVKHKFLTENNCQRTRVYVCDKCNYTTKKKSCYEAHLLTVKHKSPPQNNEDKLTCKICNKKYKSRPGLWEHKQKCSVENAKKKDDKLTCKICNKKYKSRPGLWDHKKTCSVENAKKKEETQPVLENTITNNVHSLVPDQLLLQLLKYNTDYKRMVVELMYTLERERNQNMYQTTSIREERKLINQIIEMVQQIQNNTTNN